MKIKNRKIGIWVLVGVIALGIAGCMGELDSAVSSSAPEHSSVAASSKLVSKSIQPEMRPSSTAQSVSSVVPPISSAVPQPAASAAPKPVSSTTPKPVSSAAPKPAASAAPKPAASVAPKPVSSAMPQPAPSVAPKPVSSVAPAPAPTPAQYDYVLNTNTLKFHYPSCASVKRIKSTNRENFTGTRDQVIQRGYTPCKNCYP